MTHVMASSHWKRIWVKLGRLKLGLLEEKVSFRSSTPLCSSRSSGGADDKFGPDEMARG